jgi:hypothetical protein
MQSPLLGFNNNVKHRGRLFHIQTEDSGIRHPHVITHLFMDGGRILKSIKTSYSEQLGTERLADVVRELMKEQHKTMFIALRDGHFDQAIDSSDAARSAHPASAVPKPVVPPGADRVPASGAPVGDPLLAPGQEPAEGLTLTSDHAPAPEASMPAWIPPSPRVPQGLAHSGVARGVSRGEAPDLFEAEPPKVVNVVTTGETGPPSAASSARNPPQSGERPSSGRYAASRPAALFSAARPPQEGGSLFGDDLINEKSLDEVILSYLSDDLEAQGDDKATKK